MGLFMVCSKKTANVFSSNEALVDTWIYDKFPDTESSRCEGSNF